QRKVARAVTARKLLNLPWLLPLPLPSKEGSRTARCARPSSALRAPSPASGRRVEAVPGAQAGCAFFAPGFLAQAKKGGSRRYGAKALDLDVGVPGQQAGQDPPYEAAVAVTAGRARAARCARTLIRPPGTFSRKREKGCLTDLPQAEEGLFDRCSAGGREVDPIFRKQRRRVGWTQSVASD